MRRFLPPPARDGALCQTLQYGGNSFLEMLLEGPQMPPLQSLRGHTASKEIRTVSFPLFLINPEFPFWTPMPVESIRLTRRECNCRLRLHLSAAPPKTAAGASFRCPEVPRLETSPVSATRFSVSPSWLPMSARLALAYPAGKGSNSIRRTIDANSRPIRWLSASSN